MTAGVVSTVCSGCGVPVVLDLSADVVRVAGVSAVSDLWHEEMELTSWECPVCGYSDSFHAVSS